MGQCITSPSLQFPARQEVNIDIFIMFYGISLRCYIYLVHVILDRRPCQISRQCEHSKWCCDPVKSHIWPWLCQFWPQLAFQNDPNDGANITLDCILMICRHIIIWDKTKNFSSWSISLSELLHCIWWKDHTQPSITCSWLSIRALPRLGYWWEI